jgi:mannose-6-phosphate isomerase-like protein (cupin superfamily)
MHIVDTDEIRRVEPGSTPDYDTGNPLDRLLTVVQSVRLAADRECYAPSGLQFLLPHTWLALHGPSAPNTDVLDPRQQDFKTDFQKQNVADFRLGDTQLVRGWALAHDWTGPLLHLSYRGGPDSALSAASGHRLGDRVRLHLEIEGGGSGELDAVYDPASHRYVAELWGYPDGDLAARLGPRGQESLGRGVLQARPDLARGAADAFTREALDGRDVREVAPDHVLHPVRPLRCHLRWSTPDGGAADPADGTWTLAFEMVVRGWDAFLGVGTSGNPHGGVGHLEYRNLLSNYFGYAGSGELGRHLESWNLDASGAKATPGAVEDFLAVDYMDLHLMEPGCGIGLHRHRDNSEAFLMMDGEGWMVVGDWADTERRARCFEVRTLRAGHLALLRGGNLHGLANPGAGRASLFMFGGYD